MSSNNLLDEEPCWCQRDLSHASRQYRYNDSKTSLYAYYKKFPYMDLIANAEISDTCSRNFEDDEDLPPLERISDDIADEMDYEVSDDERSLHIDCEIDTCPQCELSLCKSDSDSYINSSMQLGNKCCEVYCNHLYPSSAGNTYFESFGAAEAANSETALCDKNVSCIRSDSSGHLSEPPELIPIGQLSAENAEDFLNSNIADAAEFSANGYHEPYSPRNRIYATEMSSLEEEEDSSSKELFTETKNFEKQSGEAYSFFKHLYAQYYNNNEDSAKGRLPQHFLDSDDDNIKKESDSTEITYSLPVTQEVQEYDSGNTNEILSPQNLSNEREIYDPEGYLKKSISAWSHGDAIFFLMDACNKLDIDPGEVQFKSTDEGSIFLWMSLKDFEVLSPKEGRKLYRYFKIYKLQHNEFDDHTEDPRNLKLWEFVSSLLRNPKTCPSLIRWEDVKQGIFKFVKPKIVAKMWGMRKGNTAMTYDKFSRGLRYYYTKKVLDPVPGIKLTYKFGRNAIGWQPNIPKGS